MSHLICPGRPAVLLAPMEGVTDGPMRAFLAAMGGLTGCVSEFLRISQNVPPERTFLGHFPELQTANRTASGVPVVLQLLGGDPAKMAAAAAVGVTLGARAIDINFGCPARTVNRHDGGAALLRAPARMRAIVEAVRARVGPEVSVSAKLRLGWDDSRQLFANAEAVLMGGVHWITVHGRTKAQGYRPWANWAPIAALNRMASVPIVANGDIFTVADAARCFEITGCQHVMLGRGAVADPSLCGQVASLLGLRPWQPPHAQNQWPQWVRELMALSATSNLSPSFLPGRVKQWGKMNHLYAGGTFYQAIKTCGTVAELLHRLDEWAKQHPGPGACPPACATQSGHQ